MIAFGGAAPLHALRLAEKLDINRVIIPSGAGVGSAIGFLRAPISYEVVRSRYISLQNFDPGIVNRLMKEMSEEARKIVASGAGASELTEQRLAYMRYEGQGHEIVVPVPLRELEAKDADTLRELFETEYSNLYGRSVPGQKPEVLSWTLSVSAPGHSSIQSSQITGNNSTPGSNLTRKIFDPALSDFVNATVYKRSELGPELKYPGPAAIVETQTTTIVPSAYSFQLNEFGHLIVEKN
jgi:N-methylhydantoinase A